MSVDVPVPVAEFSTIGPAQAVASMLRAYGIAADVLRRGSSRQPVVYCVMTPASAQADARLLLDAPSLK